MNKRKKIDPELSKPIGPLSVEPCQQDHGSSIVICHPQRGIIAKIEAINEDPDDEGIDMDTAEREPYDLAYAHLFKASPDMLAALQYVQAMMEHAHKQFNWADSALDAKAIQMLNDAPVIVYNAIARATPEPL